MSEPIPTKLYALGAPKKSYTLKLCELSLEDYAHAERMLSEEMTGGALDTIYTLLAG